jgi:hypothetical protein
VRPLVLAANSAAKLSRFSSANISQSRSYASCFAVPSTMRRRQYYQNRWDGDTPGCAEHDAAESTSHYHWVYLQAKEVLIGSPDKTVQGVDRSHIPGVPHHTIKSVHVSTTARLEGLPLDVFLCKVLGLRIAHSWRPVPLTSARPATRESPRLDVALALGPVWCHLIPNARNAGIDIARIPTMLPF